MLESSMYPFMFLSLVLVVLGFCGGLFSYRSVRFAAHAMIAYQQKEQLPSILKMKDLLVMIGFWGGVVTLAISLGCIPAILFPFNLVPLDRISALDFFFVYFGLMWSLSLMINLCVFKVLLKRTKTERAKETLKQYGFQIS